MVSNLLQGNAKYVHAKLSDPHLWVSALSPLLPYLQTMSLRAVNRHQVQRCSLQCVNVARM